MSAQMSALHMLNVHARKCGTTVMPPLMRVRQQMVLVSDDELDELHVLMYGVAGTPQGAPQAKMMHARC